MGNGTHWISYFGKAEQAYKEAQSALLKLYSQDKKTKHPGSKNRNKKKRK